MDVKSGAEQPDDTVGGEADDVEHQVAERLEVAANAEMAATEFIFDASIGAFCGGPLVVCQVCGIGDFDQPRRHAVGRGYRARLESCFRRMKQTGLEVRPMYHWTPRRIDAHVKLCVWALQMQQAAERRCHQPWARIAHTLAQLKAVRYRRTARLLFSAPKPPRSWPAR